MEKIRIDTSIGEIVTAIDLELKNVNISAEKTRNRLIALMLSDILKSYGVSRL